ncbi:glycosyltransferase family 2 protein [Alloscardovia macacae]|uniref:Glycosyltransferase, group 2 family protein n=1 Tax=Alloscardovia macacae TaxID=1160091 RepID=A0A261F6J7_9BIFI|nr:glycosyltransferase family A protein [Alloscardovia macacae]OZG54757.1 glycosyltransferase, group 2 family protein [Alloscardovia macacae]
MTDKTITFVVPSYNVEDYLARCVDSLVDTADTRDVEIVIVNDGSHDRTAEIADAYAERYPDVVRVIHQENAGHGGACNAGIAAARGQYLKIVDADDWVDKAAYVTYLTFLRAQAASDQPVDLLVSNYTYENVEKHHTSTIRYANVFEAGKRLTWDDVKPFHIQQYLLMHTLTYRTAVLRDSGLKLPEHTFYVDFIFSFQPLPWVKTLTYLNIDFYRYFIGREGQSVQKDIMIKRVDQLIRVNDVMVKAMPGADAVPAGLYRYMLHYLASEFIVTSVFLILSNDKQRWAQKDELWERLRAQDERVYADMRRYEGLTRLAGSRGALGRALVKTGYTLSNLAVGFNS